MVKGEVLKKIMFNFRDTDYIHTEQHMEMEEDHEEHGDEDDHDEHGGHGGPTSFLNDATEFSTVFDFGNDVVSRKLMMSSINSEMSVVCLLYTSDAADD